MSETAYELGAVLGTAVLGSILTAWYRDAIVLPAVAHRGPGGCRGRDARRAPSTSPANCPPRSATGLVAAAAHAFDGGVVVTSLIGVGLMLAAAIVAAATLENPRGAARR